MNIATITEAYLRDHSGPRGNVQTDSRCLRAPIAAFGDMDPQDLTVARVERFIRDRRDGRYALRGSGATTGTIRRELVALQAALNFGRRHRLVPPNLVFTIEKPTAGPPRDLWINEKQERSILSQATTASLSVRLFLCMGLALAARKGALMALTWDRVHFLTESIDLEVPEVRPTRKKPPHGPMTPAMRLLLKQAQVKASPQDTHVLDRNTPYQYRKFMTSIGFGWVTPHVLKHSAITLMARSGVTLERIAGLVRTDIRTLEKVYRHHSMDELKAIAGRRR